MTADRTQTQGGEEYRHAQQLSLERTRPPIDVPGYDPQQFLGSGAYGEVWVAIDRKTGRQVAIKFYTHRGGLDWSLLTREVEKLVLMSADRYVVQLLDVGWDADPPYYVMEYIPNGSLDERLKRDGTLPAEQAVALFRDVAIGLVHAHGRGVLHCDLKPANVLLDQDNKPRLADFGQSRLSNEQDPALGTLFYMAPEQADLKAMPDARWDVYALGALLYTMLTGAPPHRDEAAILQMENSADLEDRLSRYRALLAGASQPAAHRKVPGVDGALAEIVERCLAVDPERRFPNAQAVIDALDQRESAKTKRRLVALGALGPLLLLVLVGILGRGAFNTAVRNSNAALTARALESNAFAARAQAESVTREIERRFRTVERLAADKEFQKLVEAVLANPELTQLRAQLNDPSTNLPASEVARLQSELRTHPAREALQQRFDQLLDDPTQPSAASWFFNGPNGLQLARAPSSTTIGRNYAWRNYFHQGSVDQPSDWRPAADRRLRETTLSAVLRSQATKNWIASVSTPVLRGGPGGEFLGVVAVTVEVGRFVTMQGARSTDEGGAEQLAVLVDWREGPHRGLILQHPLFNHLGKVPDRFQEIRISENILPQQDAAQKANYRDPLAGDPSGAAYQGRWLADMAPVLVRGKPSGLLVIVQEHYDHAIGQTLSSLSSSLLRIGGAIAAVMVIVPALLWWAFVVRGWRTSTAGKPADDKPTATSSPGDGMATIVDRRQR